MAFAPVLSLFFLVERNSRNFLTTQVWIRGNKKMAFQIRLRENTKEESEMQHLRKRKLPTLSMAPMIDCVFLLLLFFLRWCLSEKRLAHFLLLDFGSTVRAEARPHLNFTNCLCLVVNEECLTAPVQFADIALQIA